jgi:hypothetical protein
MYSYQYHRKEGKTIHHGSLEVLVDGNGPSILEP